MDVQVYYQKAINFAGKKHADQNIPGSNTNYMVHLSNVAMEILLASKCGPDSHREDFDCEFAVQVALLHDVLEDTSTTFDEIKEVFGANIARAVLALSKNEALPVSQQILDSLSRIKLEPKEVWAVKLADRISNLQKPPQHWDTNKITDYHKMAGIILLQLKGGNAYLENRLYQKIVDYNEFIPVASP
jgi:(p)ppGpp synthase/HD superfamily hydrolase